MSFRATFANLIVFAVLFVVLVIQPQNGRAQQASSPPTSVILVSRGAPQNVGLYDEVLAGLRAVDSEDDLESLVSASTRAIVVDQSMVGKLSSTFLAQQLGHGVFVFGLNMSERELKTMTDWGLAYQIANGRAPSGSLLENWSDTHPYQSFFIFTSIQPGGTSAGLGRLDILAGLFQVRLGRAMGLECRERVSWSSCNAGDLP